MGVNGVDLRDLNIKRLCGPFDYKINAADRELSLVNTICDLVDGFVKDLAESVCKIIYQRFTASVFGVVCSILRCVFG